MKKITDNLYIMTAQGNQAAWHPEQAAKGVKMLDTNSPVSSKTANPTPAQPKNPQELIDPMIPLRPKKMPPPPAGTFDPMFFLEEVPEGERNVWDRGCAQLPSIINTTVFSDTINTVPPPNSPTLVPTNAENQHEAIQIPSTQLSTVSKAETCKKVMVEKPSPYQTMERMLQLRAFCVVDSNLYIFEGSHYQHLTPEAAQRLIVELCRDSVETVGTPGYPKAVYDLMLIEPRILRHEEEVTNNVVCFQNGALNLTIRHLSPHSPSFPHILHNTLPALQLYQQSKLP